MLLTKALVENFKSIDRSGEVTINPTVTVLVGQNESGKTAFLQALNKARSVPPGIAYDITEDYPRKGVNEYRKRHTQDPATVAHLTYELTPAEIDTINHSLGMDLVKDCCFTLHHNYANSHTISIDIPEPPYVIHLLGQSGLSSDVLKSVENSQSVRGLETVPHANNRSV